MRQKRNVHFPGTLLPGTLDQFSVVERRVVEAVGVRRILADDPASDGVILGQLARMLMEAEPNGIPALRATG